MKRTSLSVIAFSLVFAGFGCGTSAPVANQPIVPPLTEDIQVDDGTPLENPDADIIDSQTTQTEPISAVPTPTPAPEPTPTPAPTPEPEPTPVPQPVVKKFDLIAKQWTFEPSIIRVNQGDTVVLNIKSIDVKHGFSLPTFGVNVDLEPNKTTTVEFMASKKGTFTFSCSVFCGSGHGSMKGSLIVE